MPHPCLESRQIVHLICTQMGSPRECRRDLASFAQTCRLVHQPATELLWEELDSLDPLLDIISDDLWRMEKSTSPDSYGQIRTLNREFTIQDLDALRLRAARVRSLHVSYGHISKNLKALQAIQTTMRSDEPPIFRRLHDLKIAEGRVKDPAILDAMYLLFSPSILSLEVAVEIGFGTAEQTRFAADLVKYCPKVKNLTVPSRDNFFPRGDITGIRQWAELREFHTSWWKMTREHLAVLSELPNLEKVSLQLAKLSDSEDEGSEDEGSEGEDSEEGGSEEGGSEEGGSEEGDSKEEDLGEEQVKGFRSLRHAEVGGDASHSSLLSFIKMLDNPPLESLTLKTTVDEFKWSLTSVQDILMVLPDHVQHTTLTQLVIREMIDQDDDFTTDKDECEADDPCHIHHLQAFSNLESLEFELSVPLATKLESLLKLPPSLKTLSLGIYDAEGFGLTPKPKLVWEDLVTLGQRFPFLETISMPFDASAVLQPAAGTVARHQALRDIWLGRSPISSPVNVAAFLSNGFPKAQIHGCKPGDLDEFFNDYEGTDLAISRQKVFDKWEEVRTLLHPNAVAAP
ncbi:hypothetical protein BKA70DRAFT_1472350 [Coprinopsis sp. MPI-PUGE-AT-0042]|nr:hypothetical protein BKA70DRAFT_1472350 [Coprinopsis sp. MPI-PUGE-AT-0042]